MNNTSYSSKISTSITLNNSRTTCGTIEFPSAFIDSCRHRVKGMARRDTSKDNPSFPLQTGATVGKFRHQPCVQSAPPNCSVPLSFSCAPSGCPSSSLTSCHRSPSESTANLACGTFLAILSARRASDFPLSALPSHVVVVLFCCVVSAAPADRISVCRPRIPSTPVLQELAAYLSTLSDSADCCISSRFCIRCALPLLSSMRDLRRTPSCMVSAEGVGTFLRAMNHTLSLWCGAPTAQAGTTVCDRLLGVIVVLCHCCEDLEINNL